MNGVLFIKRQKEVMFILCLISGIAVMLYNVARQVGSSAQFRV